MQEGAELEDEEKSMVEELQKAYFVCRSSSSLGLQDPIETHDTMENKTQGDTTIR